MKTVKKILRLLIGLLLMVPAMVVCVAFFLTLGVALCLVTTYAWLTDKVDGTEIQSALREFMSGVVGTPKRIEKWSFDEEDEW
jgi:hypothetical protein